MSDACVPATRAVRAGHRSGRAFGAVMPPLRAVEQIQFRRLQREAPLRLHAQRQSDARPARRGAGRTRRRRRRASSRPAAWRRSRWCCSAAAARRPRASRAHDCYGGTLAPVRCAGREGAFRASSFADLTDPRALAAALARKPEAGLDRDAVQSAAAHHRHPPRRRRRARGRRAGAWSTTRSCRRRCSSRSRSAPTSSCIRRPSTSTATATSSAAR